jgi:short-subunit dehydrogenase
MRSTFKEQYGQYALIIGASAGIGEAFANEIAARGVSLILVARRSEKLEQLSSSVRARFGVDVKNISLDLSSEGAVDRLMDETKSLNIGLLVLNAAVTNVGSFLKNSYEQESISVIFNTLTPTQLAHRIGNRMKSQGRGGILFLSSAGNALPAPLQATYAAAKAYLASFGRALSYELSSDGIDVTVLAPGMTDTEGMQRATNFDKSKMKNMRMMSAADVAKTGLDGLGRQSFVIPGLTNKLFAIIIGLLPKSTAVKIFGGMMSDIVVKDAQ